MIGARITGLNELKSQLNGLSDTLRKRVIIRSLVRSAKPLEKRMKDLAPVSKKGAQSKQYASRRHPPGYLKSSIGIVIGKGTDYPTLWVRPRVKIMGYDAWYKHFPMAGTKNIPKSSTTPFVDMAWGEMGAQVQSSLMNDLTRDIQAEINKLK